MATSTPPPDGTPPARPEPRQEILTTVHEQIAAIDELIGLAQEWIGVFDIDLSQTGWNSAERIARLLTFLREHRSAKLEIVVHDTRYLETGCPRLLALLRNFSHVIRVLRAGEDARGAMDPLVIVDGRHFLHRFHIDGARAALAIEQPQAASPLVDRFDEIRDSAEPGVSATVLGL